MANNSKAEAKKIAAACKESPERTKKALTSLFSQAGITTTSKPEMECPEELAPIVEKFNSADGKINLTPEEKKLLKPSKIVSMIKKAFKEGKTKKVKFNLGKVKKTQLEHADEISSEKKASPEDDKKEDAKTESISLFDPIEEEPMNEDAVAAIAIASGVADIVSLGLYVFLIYTMCRCAKMDHWNAFGTDKGSTGTIIGSFALMFLANLIWIIMINIQLNKIKKGEGNMEEKNESLENDSVLDMLSEASDTCGFDFHPDTLDENDSEHDSKLLAAYRLVVSDLQHRVPKDVDPTE